MKKLLLIAVFLIGTTAVFAQPKIKVEPEAELNWGKVSPGDNPLKGKVKIINVGNKELEIKRVKPTCGCTTAPLRDSKLAPGESTEVQVTMSFKGHSGHYSKNLRIYSNDPNRKMINYGLTANIDQPLEVKPTSFIPLMNLQVGLVGKGQATIRNTTGKPVKLYGIKTFPDDVSVNLGKETVIEPGEKITLKVKVRPSKPGSYKARIFMKTSNPEVPEIIMNAYGSAKKSPLFRN